MKINVISDLHLEFDDLVLPGGDVLILSGDVCEAKNVKLDQYEKNAVQFTFERKRSDRYIRFFVEECAKYRHVIYVMGNHEHYHFTYDKTYQHLKNCLPPNVYLLENETKEIDDIVFIGATLWTDCNKGDPITLLTLKDGMNEYRCVKKHPENSHNFYGKLTPEYTAWVHKNSKKYIGEQLKIHTDRKCVVVTHHAPSSLSIGHNFKSDTLMNGGYCSNLEDFILDHNNIKVWTHGHTHDLFDYNIGDTRIICNPRGYKYYEQRAEQFDPTLGFEI